MPDYSYRNAYPKANVGEGLGALLNNFVAQRNQNTQNQMAQQKLAWSDPNRQISDSEIVKSLIPVYAQQSQMATMLNKPSPDFMTMVQGLKGAMGMGGGNAYQQQQPQPQQTAQQQMVDYGDDQLNQIASMLAQKVAERAKIQRGTV